MSPYCTVDTNSPASDGALFAMLPGRLSALPNDNMGLSIEINTL
jgi:hypothetical protein